MAYHTLGECGPHGAIQLLTNFHSLYSVFQWLRIRQFRQIAALPTLLGCAGNVDYQPDLEPHLAEVLPLRSSGVAVAFPNLLEDATHAALTDRDHFMNFHSRNFNSNPSGRPGINSRRASSKQLHFLGLHSSG